MARTKSLPVEQNEAARKFVRQIVNERFGGNTLQAAMKLGVSQSLVYEFLKGTRGAGMTLLGAVSAFTGEPIETITGQNNPDTEALERDPSFPLRAEAAREARRLGVSEAAIRAVLRDGGRSGQDLPIKVWLGEMQHREEFLARLNLPRAEKKTSPTTTPHSETRKAS